MWLSVKECNEFKTVLPVWSSQSQLLLLHRLHWLPIHKRTTYKLCVLMFDVYHGTAPEYLTHLCSRCNDHRLRSSTRGEFVVRRTRTRLGRLLLQDMLRGTHFRLVSGTLIHTMLFVSNWKLTCLLHLVDFHVHVSYVVWCILCIVVRHCWAPVEWRHSKLLWWWWHCKPNSQVKQCPSSMWCRTV